jgi:hypothetical protein
MQPMVAGELGTVVECDGLAQWFGHDAEQPDELTGNAVGRLADEADCQEQAGLALMHGKNRLAVL